MANHTETSKGLSGDARGREAGRPREIPRPGWRDILLRVKEEQSKDHLSIIAAGVAFYSLLALFPALAALISLYGLVADPAQVQQQLSQVSGFLPPEAHRLLDQQLSRIVSQSGGALSLALIGGVLLALWSAAKGMNALITALNVAYDEEETRGFFKLNGLALLLTFLGILFVLISLTLITAVPALLGNLGLPGFLQAIVNIGRWFLLAVLIMLGLAALYRYAPDRDQPQWNWVSWGSGIATALWILASLLFSFYVANFASYNETYGSVGAIIILLMWFYLTAYVILLGAELNAEMERQTRKDTTRGESRPMGERGAYAADTLGKKP